MSEPNDPAVPYPGQPWAPSAPTPAWGPPPQAGEDPLISRDYAGWCARGAALVKASWRTLVVLQLIQFGAVLVLMIPMGVVAGMMFSRLWRAIRAAGPNEAPHVDLRPGELPVLVVVWLVSILLFAGVSTLVKVASYRVAIAAGTGSPLPARRALRAAVPRLLPLIGWAMLAAPIYLLGVLLCFLPVFYVAAALAVLPVVVAVERTNAIGRSFSLFHAAPGPALGRLLSIVAVGMVLSVVVNVIAQVAIVTVMPGQNDQMTPARVGALIAVFAGVWLLGLLVQTLAEVVTIPLLVLTYADLRARADPATTAATILADLQLAPAG